MATRKQPSKTPGKAPQKSTATTSPGPQNAASSAAKSSSRSTMSGPSREVDVAAISDAATAKMAGAETLASSMPFNAAKPSEHGDAAKAPATGQSVEPPHPMVTGSTLTETNASEKVGRGNPQAGFNPGNGPLDRVRVDSGGRALTTNFGVPISDNQNSLKAGLRGPALLEDFILREKITHFDHERIPERIVHARGSAAHGYFECYDALTDVTRAAPFAEAGKITPVFVRFSTVAGERFPMKLDEPRLTLLVHEAKGMNAETLHHAQAARNRAIRHDPHQHMRRFRHE